MGLCCYFSVDVPSLSRDDVPVSVNQLHGFLLLLFGRGCAIVKSE